MRLVLWDIDGTLVDGGGAGLGAFEDAFERLIGRRPADLAEMSGRTDWDIGLDILERNGVEDGEALWPAFAEELADALAAREDELRAAGRALAGGREAILAVAEADGAIQSVLTGNVPRNAATKLRAFGLDELLDLEVGAYGTDSRDRRALVAIARERAEARHGAELAPEDIVLVGDTPRDVDAALANGARVLGVATGQFSARALAEAGAETVLTDLSDTDAVVDAVLAVSELSR